MRAIMIVMSCLVAGAAASAVAQTAGPEASAPSATSAPAAAAAPTPAPAPAPAAATTPAAPSPAPGAPAVAADQAQTAFEKQLIAKGYKPAMVGNQKMYCHNEDVLGSRLGGHKVCATADQLAVDMHNAKELTEQAQKMPVNSGH